MSTPARRSSRWMPSQLEAASSPPLTPIQTIARGPSCSSNRYAAPHPSPVPHRSRPCRCKARCPCCPRSHHSSADASIADSRPRVRLTGRGTQRLSRRPPRHLAVRTRRKPSSLQYVFPPPPPSRIAKPPQAPGDLMARCRAAVPCCRTALFDPGFLLTRFTAVIYVKNRVNRAWAGTDHFPNEHPIPEDEKARVRDRLLPILASSQGLIRQQLIPILQRILHWDFPEKWPTFMDFTIQLLNTNDPSSVLAGLQCLLAICRAYRFKAGDGENRAHFDKIIEASFPRLLAISSELVAQESEEAGEMLHIALKAYKHATWVSHTLLGLNTLLCRQPLSNVTENSSIYPHFSENSKTRLAGVLSSSVPFPRLRRPLQWPMSPSSGNDTTGGKPRNGHTLI